MQEAEGTDTGKKKKHHKISKNIKQKVAIIGGGPAGLTCAAFLAKDGVNVTIYENTTIQADCQFMEYQNSDYQNKSARNSKKNFRFRNKCRVQQRTRKNLNLEELEKNMMQYS